MILKLEWRYEEMEIESDFLTLSSSVIGIEEGRGRKERGVSSEEKGHLQVFLSLSFTKIVKARKEEKEKPIDGQEDYDPELVAMGFPTDFGSKK
jgi:hypothetical protein